MSKSKPYIFLEKDLIDLGLGILKALNHLTEYTLFHGDLRPKYIGKND